LVDVAFAALVAVSKEPGSLVVEDRNSLEGTRWLLLHADQLGKRSRYRAPIGVGHGSVERAHRRKGADVAQWASTAFRVAVLQIPEPRHLLRDCMDAIDQGLAVCPVVQELCRNGAVEGCPAETLLAVRVAEPLPPERFIPEPVEVLLLAVEGEGEEAILHPAARYDPPNRGAVCVEIPFAGRRYRRPVDLNTLA